MAQRVNAMELQQLPSQPQGAERDNRHAAFRKLITDISEHLRPEDVTKCTFIRGLPKDRSLSALDTLSYLMQVGTFSHKNVEPLVDLLKDVKRHDLVHDLVGPYRAEHPDGIANIPQAPVVQEIGTSEAFSAEEGFTAHHSNNISHSATQQHTKQVLTAEMLQYAQTTSPMFSQEEIEQPDTTPESLQVHNNESQVQKVYTPVSSLHESDRPLSVKVLGKSQCASTSSSISELLRYNTSSNDNLLTYDTGYLPEETPSYQTYQHSQQSVTPPTVTPTLPRANSYPRSHALKLKTSNTQGAIVSSQSTLKKHAQSMMQQSKLRSRSVTRSSMTPPNAVDKQTSTFSKRCSEGYETNPLPQGLFFRPLYASTTVASQHSVCGTLDCDRQEAEYSPYEMGTMTLPSPKSYGSSHANGSAAYRVEGSDQGMMFHKRRGSKKKLLSKLRRQRNSSSSNCHISWTLKRDKLNEVIYKPRKDKLFKCPNDLELENAGKHSPRLTLYLQPYGYEEDAGKHLTLSVELSASVKSNIPSSAKIRIEFKASETARGTLLRELVLEDSANFRIIRSQAFLSHALLKVLECDGIDIQASAYLLN